MASWFYPGYSGSYVVDSLHNEFIQKLAGRIEGGLFSMVSSRRNRYEIVSQSENSLHFRSSSLLTGIFIGLNDVKIQIERSSNEIKYDVTYWIWAKFCIFLSIGITSIIGFFFVSHLFGLYIFQEIEYPSSFEMTAYVMPMILFWGIIWPWILINRHKTSAEKCLIRILNDINCTNNNQTKANNKNSQKKYKTLNFWRSKLVWLLVVILLLLIGKLIHRRWTLGPAHFGYSVGTQPDEKLPRRQQTCPGVDLQTVTPNDFPGFLGKNRSCAVDYIKLNPDWEKHQPKLIWRQQIGAGWPAFSIANGFAVTMEQRGPEEQVTCYALESGKHHWTVSWNERFFLFGDGPRSTPTIANGKVFALGAWGHLTCIDGNTGNVIWERELLKDLGIHWQDEHKTVMFGRSNSPLVTGQLVIVPGGGLSGKRSSLLAYDTETGELRWKGGAQQISYSSPVLADLLGEKQVLIVNEDTVSGHLLETGVELWSYPWISKSNRDVNVSQPVTLPGNRILISKGYGRGAAVIELSREESKKQIQVKKVWSNSEVLRTKFTNVVMWKNYAYGLSDGRLECVDLETGKRCWKEGRYGHGQMLRVHDLLLLQSEKGELFLIDLDPQTPNKVLGSIQALTGKTWNNLAIYGRFLLVRNATEAACFELATFPLVTDHK